MGIYYDHGVEYVVITRQRKHVIVPLKEADQRLLQTEYYKSRKDSWFSEHGSFCRAISEGNINIELTESEKGLLDSVLKTAEDIESHGWYDVQVIYDTYGL